ncbi:MAG: hypothetical protein M3068_03990 [Gemmatimonadota bacterium]|nr:hypothetical protein [Gemmatimonadota bacterium]
MGKNKHHGGRKQVEADAALHPPADSSRQVQTETLHSQVGQHRTAPGPTHDPAAIRAHDDAGRDRLFEGRQQHDDAEKSSEKTRLARDVDKHKHADDGSASQPGRARVKRKK